MGSIVLRATFSPAAALLQLLVVRLLAAFFVLHICGAKRATAGHMQLCWLLACAGASTSWIARS